MRKIIVLGSSGSVGMQTLDIVSKMGNKAKIKGLAVDSDIKTLKLQISRFMPAAVAVNNSEDAISLKKWCAANSIKTNVYGGHRGLEKLAAMPGADTVFVAVVGAAGLKPTLAAIKSKKNIAVANKEILVMAGTYIVKLAAASGVSLLPVDSEHSAIFQCCRFGKSSRVKRIILTASGGPFYAYSGDFSRITVKQALAHPTWKMGRKITVDSATLMNKGLEAIEASVLFDVPIEQIEIVIHPQSIVHSMIEYVDGSVIAQLSNPDMKLPIQYALTYPERLPTNIKPLNLAEIGRLEFYKPDFSRFPCLKLAYYAAEKGYTMPAVMNAANEVAVAAFLNEKIKFTCIAKTVEKTMQAHSLCRSLSLNVLIEADFWAREYAEKLIGRGI